MTSFSSRGKSLQEYHIRIFCDVNAYSLTSFSPKMPRHKLMLGKRLGKTKETSPKMFPSLGQSDSVFIEWPNKLQITEFLI